MRKSGNLWRETVGETASDPSRNRSSANRNQSTIERTAAAAIVVKLFNCSAFGCSLCGKLHSNLSAAFEGYMVWFMRCGMILNPWKLLLIQSGSYWGHTGRQHQACYKSSLKNPDLWGASVWRFKMQAAYLWMWVREFKCVRLNLNAGYQLQLEEQTTVMGWWRRACWTVRLLEGSSKSWPHQWPLERSLVHQPGRRGARYCAQPPLWPAGDGASCSKSNLLLCGSLRLLKAA